MACTSYIKNRRNEKSLNHRRLPHQPPSWLPSDFLSITVFQAKGDCYVRTTAVLKIWAFKDLGCVVPGLLDCFTCNMLRLSITPFLPGSYLIRRLAILQYSHRYHVQVSKSPSKFKCKTHLKLVQFLVPFFLLPVYLRGSPSIFPGCLLLQ